jgi:hypothetical protein
MTLVIFVYSVSYFHFVLFSIRNTVSHIIKISLVIRYQYVTISSAINSKEGDFIFLQNPISFPCTTLGYVVIKDPNSNSRKEFFFFRCHVVVVLVDTWPYLFRIRVLFVTDKDSRVTIMFWNIGKPLLLPDYIRFLCGYSKGWCTTCGSSLLHPHLYYLKVNIYLKNKNKYNLFVRNGISFVESRK